jgi:hypothetical protein
VVVAEGAVLVLAGVAERLGVDLARAGQLLLVALVGFLELDGPAARVCRQGRLGGLVAGVQRLLHRLEAVVAGLAGSCAVLHDLGGVAAGLGREADVEGADALEEWLALRAFLCVILVEAAARASARRAIGREVAGLQRLLHLLHFRGGLADLRRVVVADLDLRGSLAGAAGVAAFVVARVAGFVSGVFDVLGELGLAVRRGVVRPLLCLVGEAEDGAPRQEKQGHTESDRTHHDCLLVAGRGDVSLQPDLTEASRPGRTNSHPPCPSGS